MLRWQIKYLRQSRPPSLHFLFSKPIFVFRHVFSEAISLLHYIWWIYMVEHWQNNLLLLLLLQFHDPNKFIQTPCGRCIVLRKHNNENPRFFNGLFQSRWKTFPYRHIPVIIETLNSLPTQLFSEMPYKIASGICASETNEHIVPETDTPHTRLRMLNQCVVVIKYTVSYPSDG